MLVGGPYVYGFSAYAHPFADFDYAESLKEGNETDTSYVSDRMLSGSRGARNVQASSLDVAGQMGDASPLIPDLSHVLNEGFMPTLAADGWPISYQTTGGGTQGMWVNATDAPYAGNSNNSLSTVSGMAGMYGMEQDTSFSNSEMVNEHIGIDVVDQSFGYAQTPYTGVSRHGLEFDAAVDVSGPSWGTMYAIGSATNGWSGNPETTIMKAFQKEYAIPQYVTAFVARDGVDFRGMMFGGSAFTSAGFAVNSAGSVSGTLMETGNGVQALNASVTGATVVEGGLYNSFPTFTVDAPQLGGTTAVVSTKTMGLFDVTGFNATGKGYKNGDVLTAGTGLKTNSSGAIVADVGVAGTSPTFTVSNVDQFGGITAGTWTTNGAVTDTPADHLLTMVYNSGSGSGTGAVFFVSWTMATCANNGVPVATCKPNVTTNLSPSAYVLLPTGWVPGATGAGFKVGDTFAPTTDLGTEGQLKVGEVTPTGAIMMQGMTLVSGGSVPATSTGGSGIGTESPRSFATSGSGTGANLNFGYTVLTATAGTAGSGYLADVQPRVIPQQSGWWNAKVRAVLTPTPATLALNPQGGDVSVVNGNLNMSAGKSVFSTDMNGNRNFDYLSNGVEVSLLTNSTGAVQQSAFQRDNFIVGAGKVYLGSNKTEWVQEINGKVTIGTGTTNLFSVDGSGNVIAKGAVTQNGSP